MKINETVHTPRFLDVRINAVLNPADARDLGYKEPTHYESDDFEILGRSIGENRMIFAAVLKPPRK